jgi:protein involved in polysaccharide export with SLBB domain
MSRQRSARFVAALAVSALLCAFVTVIAGPQGKPPPPVPPVKNAAQDQKDRPPLTPDGRENLTVRIDQNIDAYDLKPHPLTPIPDNPPPHEGAMIDLPYIVDPTDLILVEVLEALPGRPISGERLVQPDGRIDLGFYGEIPVRVLTPQQIKVAVIKHLRRFLSDEVLGLIAMPDEEPVEGPAVEEPAKTPKRAIPEPPKALNPFEPDRIKPASSRAGSAKTRSTSARVARGRIPLRGARLRRTGNVLAEEPGPERNQFKIDAGSKGRITITIEVDTQGRTPFEPAEPGPPPHLEHPESARLVSPEECDRVFIDVTAYNSKNYYILGDVQTPGRLPWTGHETVLDALQFAGGFIATAEPKDIRLVRPARGGKPAKVYKVDLEAIQDKGDVTSNYQLFPGDRLIVGRNAVVKKTIEVDRLISPLQGIVGSMLQTAFALRAMQNASPENPGQLYRDLVDFWIKELSRKGELQLDEQTVREALLRQPKRGASSDEKK